MLARLLVSRLVTTPISSWYGKPYDVKSLCANRSEIKPNEPAILATTWLHTLQVFSSLDFTQVTD
jgi:hypothetical protein